MKRILIALLFCIATINTIAQNRAIEGFIQPYITVNSCGEKQCFTNAIISEIKEVLREDSLKVILENKNKILLGIRFIVDKDGSIFENSIDVSNPSEEIRNKIRERLINIKGINPVRNELGIAILESFELYTKLTLEDGEIVSESFKDSTEFNKVISREKKFIAPIYKGCNKYVDSNKNLRKCFSNNMKMVVRDNFNVKKATIGFDFSGTFRTFIIFKVNEQGKIIEAETFSQTKEMGTEALRSIKKHKKITPGTSDGKTVKVRYTIPITLRLD